MKNFLKLTGAQCSVEISELDPSHRLSRRLLFNFKVFLLQSYALPLIFLPVRNR
jgi:hypothetical protein